MARVASLLLGGLALAVSALVISRTGKRRPEGLVLHPNYLYLGRTMFQAPEVDGVTYVHADRLSVGDFARVRITDTLEYDLIGEVP